MPNLPLADAGEEKKKVRAIAQERGLVGATNNTKWNELVTFMRQNDGWRPSYRYKWVDGFLSGWDVEWWYHLPLPFVGVEWFDIRLHEHVRRGRLLKDEVIDHSASILTKLAEIGFEFEVAQDVVRIFGYLPKSLEDFPPNAAP